MEIESSQSSSQTSEVSNFQDNGDFYLVYDNVGSEWQDYEEFIMSENYFEDQVFFLNGLLKLPYDVEILITTCGQANAFYSPSEKKIEICYEYVEDQDYRFSQIYEMGTIELDTAVIDVVDSTFYHELGHAIIDIYQLPYTGLNEDAADQFSNYIMTEHTDAGIGQRVLEHTALDYYLLHEEHGMESALYADTHSLDIQRFQNTACFAYGSNPTANQALVSEGFLPQNRIQWCVEEYEHGVRAWNFLLEPFFK